MVPKSSQHAAEFPIVSMILYGWIQSSAMFKQQHVRWYGFQWSILISIDYVWSVYIHAAISTPWYSFCIWNSNIKNHHWKLAWCGKRSLMQDCSEWKAILYGNNRYIDGRRECEDIRDSREIIYIYICMYLYIYYPSNLLIFVLNNYIIP